MKTPFFTFAAAVAVLLTGCRTKQEVVVPPATSLMQPTSSPGTKYALLPAAVQHTVTAVAGSAEIKDINKVPGEGNEHDYYEITFRYPAVYPTLYVSEDGTLLNDNPPAASGAPAWLGGTGSGGGNMITRLPYPVQRTLELTAPGAVVVDVQQPQRNVYEFSFKDPALHPNLFIAEDGTLLKQTTSP